MPPPSKLSTGFRAGKAFRAHAGRPRGDRLAAVEAFLGGPPSLSPLTLPVGHAVRTDPGRKADVAGGRVRRALLGSVSSGAARLICARRTRSGWWPGFPAPPSSHHLRLIASRLGILGDFLHESRVGLSEPGAGEQREAAKRILAGMVKGGEEVQAREDPRRKAAQGVGGGGALEKDPGMEGGMACPVDRAGRPWSTDLRRVPEDCPEARFHSGRSSASAPRGMARPPSGNSKKPGWDACTCLGRG